jgi:hypothetical protein
MGLLSKFIPGIDTDMILKPISIGGDLASIFTFLQQSALFDRFSNIFTYKNDYAKSKY